jgi:hypothetical protein
MNTRRERNQLLGVCAAIVVAAGFAAGLLRLIGEISLGFGFLAGLVSYSLIALPIFNVYFRNRSIQGTRLVVSDQEICQVDSDGEVLEAVRLDRPFVCDELYREEGHAAYRLHTRGLFGSRVDFLSDDPCADHVVRDLLGKEWPPPPPRSFYGH